MRFIGDFHIHSHFSIATSKNLVPEQLEYWAKLKGINVVGTGDFTHPAWLEELKDKLKPAEPGLYALKDELGVQPVAGITPPEAEVRFMLTAEISTIYKKDGKVRKVHNLIFVQFFRNQLTDLRHPERKFGHSQTIHFLIHDCECIVNLPIVIFW